jgi:RNA polymerase sigma-70 factor (ECF subfamily)
MGPANPPLRLATGQETAMADDPSFDDLMARLRTGDDEAAARVFRRFAGRLIALARGRLGSRVRQKVDPEDVAQSVFRSFFARQANGQFALEDWDGLWGLLTLLTLRKCHRQYERFTAGCRDMRREVSAPSPADGSGVVWEAIAREPTPADAAVLTELVDALMRPLEERERQILELRLQGYAVPEIGATVGRTERTVHRVLERVRKRLERMDAEDEPGA